MTEEQVRMLHAFLSGEGFLPELSDYLLEQQDAHLVELSLIECCRLGERRREIYCFESNEGIWEAYHSPNHHNWVFSCPEFEIRPALDAWLLVNTIPPGAANGVHSQEAARVRELLQVESYFYCLSPASFLLQFSDWQNLPGSVQALCFFHKAGWDDGEILEGPELAERLHVRPDQVCMPQEVNE